jgi:hypothetical protein
VHAICRRLNIYTWGSLRCIDWNFYLEEDTLSFSRPDAVLPIIKIPEAAHHLIERPELRLELQKQLYWGLSRWWWRNNRIADITPSQPRGILDMGALVVLVGMRFPKWSRYNLAFKSLSSDLKALHILIVLLNQPGARTITRTYGSLREGAFWGNEVNLGTILDQYYRHGILEEPKLDDISTYRTHTANIAGAL